MKRTAWLGALVLAGASAGVGAQTQRYCYDANGDRYTTYSSRCPERRPKEPSTIRACTLPDGSKAFGDRCPVAGIKSEKLDANELSNRQSGMDGKGNDERMIRYGQQQERQNQMERWQADAEAMRERNRAESAERQREYEAQRSEAEEQRRSRRANRQ